MNPQNNHLHSLFGRTLAVVSLLSLLTLLGQVFWPIAVTTAQTSCAPPPPGLVSWWPAGNHTFDIQDGNHATLVNGATYATAKVGPGFSLDGVDDRVEIPDAANLKPANVTVSAWVKFNALDTPGASTAGLQYIVFKRNSRTSLFEGYSLSKRRVSGTDRLEFVVASASGVQVVALSTTAVTAGQLYHVAGTYDGTTARLYVNGVLESQQFAGFPLDYGTRPVFIGSTEESWNGRLNGVVDELQLFNRALTITEIQALSNADSTGQCKPFTYALNSKATFLRTNSDNPVAPLLVDLASIGLVPGEQIKIRFAAQGFSFFGCSGPFASLSQIGINAVFGNSTTLLSPPNQFRVPGAIDAGVDFITANTHFGGQPTDIPQDFLVAHTVGTVVQIPAGATQLFVGVIDSYYQDNCGNLLILIERVNRAPVAACQSVTVSADANCTATAAINNGSADPDGDAITITQSPAGPYPLGNTLVTLTVTDSKGAASSCTATVTVTDTTTPQITAPAAASYQCLSEVPPGSPSQATATDHCSTPTITVADAFNGGAGSIASPLVITRVFTATDAAGNSNSATQTITVLDNTPPVLACLANLSVAGNLPGSCEALVNPGAATATDNCAGVTVTSARSDNQPLNAAYPLGTTTITWMATDAAGNRTTCQQQITVTNPIPVVTLTGPPTGSVYAVNTPVSFTGSFTDNAGGTHTAIWTFDSLTAAGVVNATTGAITGSYTFTQAGVYKVTLTVLDGCGGAAAASTIDGLDLLIVVYDPNGGWVTGGGWINSPAGAYVPNPSLTGKANFGFVSKYQNGATVPTGKTEFQFKAGNLNFSSTSYEWLVIAGARAQYKGAGTINGAGNYRFMLTAIDGQQPGGGGADKFRIRIWNSTDGGLVYDNQLNAPEDADPSTTLGGGNIVIHR